MANLSKITHILRSVILIGVCISGRSYAQQLHFSPADSSRVAEYRGLLDESMDSVKRFFGGSFQKPFAIFIHPDRHSLDSTWAKDWGSPGLHSECWMVASGVGSRLDLLSPQAWATQACEHKYENRTETRRLFTHEIVHVFHGQQCASPDFSKTEGIDWFVEGLATYASGQCDAKRIGEVKTAIAAGKIPMALDSFWTGQLKYGLSGSLVFYIDHRYGRTTLIRLLPLTTKKSVLDTLGCSEEQLLADWKKFLLTLA